MKTRTLLLVLAGCVLASACGKKNKNTAWSGDFTTPLVDGHLREDPEAGNGGGLKTDFCYPDPSGSYGDAIKYTDKVTVSKGHDGSQDPEIDWGQGGACVNRSIRETWAALNNQAAMVWSGVTTSNYSVETPPGGVALFYKVNYHVDNGFPLPSVDWQMNWFHSLHGGDMSAPKQIVIKYGKVSGTTYIKVWHGSITLDFISPTITAITGRDEINASRTSADDAQGSVQDVINHARSATPNWAAIGGHLDTDR